MKPFVLFLLTLFIYSLGADYILHFKEKLQTLDTQHLDWDAKGHYVYETLQQFASRTQIPVQRVLEKNNISYKSFWISNVIIVHNVTKKQLETIEGLPEIDFILEAPIIRLEDTKPVPVNMTNAVGPEHNVMQVKAPEAWKKGVYGKGIVVGVLDTGVNFVHVDIIQKYRGYKTSRSFSHDYNWFDGVKDKRCKNTPCDPQGHGSHVCGTIVGSNGQFQIGVAPSAQWIACRSLDHMGSATVEDILNCLQWFLSPTTTIGTRPDPSKRPHIINNSWGGMVRVPAFEDAINALQNAGVFVMFAAGNWGPKCGTVGWPGAYEPVTTIGALDYNSNILAYFSSRGPIAKQTYIKPNIVAPGTNIKSISHQGTNTYAEMSGTSMATPCAAGVAALLLSAKKDLVGNPQKIRQVLQSSAFPLKARGCSSPQDLPNYFYGYGLTDALRAVNIK